ncbi:MAG: transglycosylase domain-containing protein [Anaerolineae bacterium]|nr:transglycosylase domain-containing protein [Anaerolineae bacterium]
MPTPDSIVRRRIQRRQQHTGGAHRWTRTAGMFFAGCLGVAVLGSIIGTGALVLLYAYIAQDLPDPQDIVAVQENFKTTRIFDSAGATVLQDVIDPRGGDRQWVTLAEISDYLEWATIAIEDSTFYENPGFDLWGLGRALWNDLTGGYIQGASTITQQLVKNVLFEPEYALEISVERKVREVILATEISRTYSKPQVLEWYLNTNSYANLAYGIEAAAQLYFSKHASDLTLAEAAVLAAIPQFPAMNPIDNPDLAKQRQLIVLNKMVEEGYISQREASEAAAEPIVAHPLWQRYDILTPHFTIYSQYEAERILDNLGLDGAGLVNRGGLRIYTTIDLDLQYQVECAARTHIVRLSGAPPDTVIQASDGSPCYAAEYLPALPEDHQGWDHKVSNAAVVVIDVKTGEILAMLGSLDYNNEAIDGAFNATLGMRQPGSAFKPFTYVTAFAQGYTPATMTLDVRMGFPQGGTLPDYVPENYDRAFHGPVSIRTALANSYNIPAVQVMRWVGVDEVIKTAHRMGIDSLNQDLNHYGLSLTLGGGEVNLVDLTYAYSVFAGSGVMHGTPVPDRDRRAGYRTLNPVSLKRVEIDTGEPLPVVLWQYGQEQGTYQTHVVLAEPLAYLINDILSDTEARWPQMGVGNPLELSRPAAAKTGTTNDFIDSWTVGYTPQLAVGVWVGNTDSTPMVDTSGLWGAGPIWHAVMEYAHAHLDLPVETWVRPPGIREIDVCEISGLLPTGYCPTHKEIFIAGTEPTQTDTMYRPYLINRDNGLLATVYTDPAKIEERIYPIFPPEAADWVREMTIVQPPTEYDVTNIPTTADLYGDVTIIDPSPFAYVSGVVDIVGNARASGFSFYRLAYGEGISPTEWFQIGSNQARTRNNEPLGQWNTSALDGLYSLRLTVVRGNNTVIDFVVPVTVDNQAPSVSLTYPEDGQVYTLQDEFITLQPRAKDNVSMDRVEIFMDGVHIATSTVPPFSARWTIENAGPHQFWAVAYDAAGNSYESNHVNVTVE